MGNESTRMVKAIIEGHPEKELIQRFLKQQQELYGNDLYINITKKDFLTFGLLRFFPILKKD